MEFIKNFPVGKAVTAVVLVVVCLAVTKILLVLFDKLMKKNKQSLLEFLD